MDGDTILCRRHGILLLQGSSNSGNSNQIFVGNKCDKGRTHNKTHTPNFMPLSLAPKLLAMYFMCSMPKQAWAITTSALRMVQRLLFDLRKQRQLEMGSDMDPGLAQDRDSSETVTNGRDVNGNG